MTKKEQFFAEMKEALMRLKPEGMEITFMRFDKQNRMGLHGCTLAMPEAAAAPTFYLEDLYEAYLNGTAVEDIAEGVIEFAKENNRAVIPNGIDVVDYESARKHLGLMVIGAEENREYLETLVHEVIEGLALVPIIFIKDKNSTGCIKIKNEFLALWGVTPQDVMEEARQNAPNSMPPTLRAMGDIIGETSSQASDDLYVPEEEILVVNNEDFVYGASAVFYPGLLERIWKALGTDFYILPSSINEMLILRDLGQDPMMLLNIVKTVNRTEVSPEEILADAVFYYSRNGGFRRVLPAAA
jgi:hypothetical protein